MLALYLSVLDDRNFEEDFTEVYNTYKRLVYHTAYKIMDDSYLAEDVLQEVFLYVAKNFSKIHRENCHELAAYLVSYSRSRAYVAMGYTNREIAKSLGLTDEVVRTRLFRGRKLLWKEMNSHE